MVIGYLHVGHPADGIWRYGHLLARAASARCGLSILEAEVALTNSIRHDRRQFIRAARSLATADVVHVQYNPRVWGEDFRALYFPQLFARYCGRPLAVTFHDVYTNSRQRAALISAEPSDGSPRARSRARLFLSPKFLTRRIIKRLIVQPIRQTLAYTWAWQWLARTARILIVCSEEEAARLGPVVGRSKISIIPHFVEERCPCPDRPAIRKELGLERFQVITLLGWIHKRKGHELLLDAMALLPEKVYAVFAGQAAPRSHSFIEELLARAKRNGVAHRLRITGYLPEPLLNQYLTATDLAICPFSSVSASGSLSTWIAVGKPILASNLPQVAEYGTIEAGSIRTFHPYTAEALARAINESLACNDSAFDPAVARLRDRLAIANVVDQHVMRFRSILHPSG